MTASSARLFTRLALVPGLVFSLFATSFALASPAEAQKIRGDFFGMHDNQVANGGLPAVGLGSLRLWDTGTSWRQIETAPGQFDWAATDRAVDTARNAGLRPMLVLGQTPQFHAKNPKAPSAYGDGASSMPSLKAWKRYVTAAAKRYGTKVDYQVWNEPNVINYWSGSVGQMASLTAAASKAVTKAAGRKATVVAPSMPLRLGIQQKWYKKFWSSKVARKSVASFVDVVAVNPYPLPEQGPEASLPLMSYAKRALPKAARKKPMWNTEINFGLAQGGSGESQSIPADQQAAYVARTLLLNAGSNIRRVYWYTWGSPIGNTRLVQDDRTTVTEAGRAWDVVRGWLNGTDAKACKKIGKGKLAGVYTCTARESRTEVRRFYWKPSGKKATLTTSSSTRSWTNLEGQTTAKKGRFKLSVGQSPVMVTSRR